MKKASAADGSTDLRFNQRPAAVGPAFPLNSNKILFMIRSS